VLNLCNVNCDSRSIPFFSQDLCTLCYIHSNMSNYPKTVPDSLQKVRSPSSELKFCLRCQLYDLTLPVSNYFLYGQSFDLPMKTFSTLKRIRMHRVICELFNVRSKGIESWNFEGAHEFKLRRNK